jgi:hypothetical protein
VPNPLSGKNAPIRRTSDEDAQVSCRGQILSASAVPTCCG